MLEKIEVVVRPVIEKSGFQLYDMEYGGGALRIFIDKDSGVSVADCAEITHLIGPLLDVEDIIPGSYDLEVSSPGLDRILRKPQHFAGALGKKMKVKTKSPMAQWNTPVNENDKYHEARHNITGTLVEVQGDQIVVEADQRKTLIPMSEVVKAQIIFELEKGEKKGKKSHGR